MRFTSCNVVYMFVLHVLYKSSRNANMHHNFMSEGYALPSAFHIIYVILEESCFKWSWPPLGAFSDTI